MNNFNSWYITCNNWLVPLGFEECYKNHPALVIREFHWIKNGIRICCVYDSKNENFCYVHNDVVSMRFPFAIKSCRYIIGDPKVLEIHEWFKPIESILQENR